MTSTLTLCLALFAFGEQGAQPIREKGEKVDKTTINKIQGKWQLARSEHGGKAMDPKEVAMHTLEVAGVRLTVREGDETKEDSNIILLETKAKPATVDVKIAAGTDRDKVARGIWKLEPDRLTICVAEPGKERPTEFAGKEGTGHTLLIFERPKKK